MGVSALVGQDDKGNQYDTTVEMLIEVNDGSGWMHEEKVTIGPGKISGQYLESHIIDAPKKSHSKSGFPVSLTIVKAIC